VIVNIAFIPELSYITPPTTPGTLAHFGAVVTLSQVGAEVVTLFAMFM
jgi:hypothetical protein